MLPVYKLMEKIGQAYDHALNERVDQFQKVDKEITSLIPLYIQHITYSSQAVRNLNMVQVSTLFTQITKLTLTTAILVGLVVVFALLPVIEGAIGGLLAGVTIGFGLLYAWKKIPILRNLWESTRQMDVHSTNLYVSLSECIRSLEEIKSFHQATVPTVAEWERKGLLKEEEEVDTSEAVQSIDNFLKELTNRSHYDKDND